MGSMMAFAFSELGLDVSVWDVDKRNVDKVMDWTKKATTMKGKIEGFTEIDDFTKSLEGHGIGKLFMFSITHGHPADSVLKLIKPDLKRVTLFSMEETRIIAGLSDARESAKVSA